jgi:hypothetical protein
VTLEAAIMVRSNIAKYCGLFNLLLTIATAIVILTGLAGRGAPKTSAGGLGDVLSFGIVWAYLLLTLPAFLVALILGTRAHLLVRANYLVLALWVAFLIWAVTATGTAVTPRSHEGGRRAIRDRGSTEWRLLGAHRQRGGV